MDEQGMSRKFPWMNYYQAGYWMLGHLRIWYWRCPDTFPKEWCDGCNGSGV